MKIDEILKKKKVSISFEFFPPKTQEAEEELFRTIKSLIPLHPTFVSVTYGAGGSTRDRTKNVVKRIKRETELTVMAHLTCIGHTRREIVEILEEYRDMGIENILALRGDIPVGEEHFAVPEDGCHHAEELVKLIKEYFGDYFSIGVASYPETHIESPNMERELYYFKKKVEAGASFSITQMFFENRYFYDFLKLVRKEGINIPIIPGIMPITNFSQIRRFASLCGATIPEPLVKELESAKNTKEAKEVGIRYAVSQCQDLLTHGVKGLHFFTLNKSDATIKIYREIKGYIDLIDGERS